jgi:hypothetical protein
MAERVVSNRYRIRRNGPLASGYHIYHIDFRPADKTGKTGPLIRFPVEFESEEDALRYARKRFGLPAIERWVRCADGGLAFPDDDLPDGVTA